MSSKDKDFKFRKTPERILFYPDDPREFCEFISDLIKLKYFIRRTSKHQIKHREVNYYRSTGTITIDGIGRQPEKGPKAFLKLLEQMYPRRRPKGSDEPTPPPPPTSPHPFVLNFDLLCEDEVDEMAFEYCPDHVDDPPL